MWAAFFEHLRHCGRSGYPFVLVLVIIGVGASFGPVGMGGLLVLLGAYLTWFFGEVRRQQDRFERLGPQPPLASVDLRLARTRLANAKTQRLLAEQSQRLKTQRLGRTGVNPPLRLRPR